FNDQQKFYPDLLVDGQIGPRTLSALKFFLSNRGNEGEIILIRALNCSQGQRYLELAEQRQANESFIYGWMKERVKL
ncbi:putative peptidoglycan-binding domain-containing protein, partial [Salmonella enterica]